MKNSNRKIDVVLTLAFTAFCTLLLIFGFLQVARGKSPNPYFWYGRFPVLGTIILLMIWGLITTQKRRENILLTVISSYFSLFALNVFLASLFSFHPERQWEHRIAAARALGVKFDERKPSEILQDLRASGQDVWSVAITPGIFVTDPLKVDGNDVIPVGGIPSVTVVGGNEGGTYFQWHQDRYGLYNPDKVWNASRHDIALIGDSLILNPCMPSALNIGGFLAKKYDSVDLGYGSNGPLLELGILREFLQKYQFKKVFWFFFEGNDFEDLNREIKSSILRNYLGDKNYTQHLLQNYSKASEAIKSASEIRIRQQMDQQTKNLSLFSKENLMNDLLLVDIHRFILHILKTEKFSPSYIDLENIWHQAKIDIEAQGGQLTIVYLPSYDSFNVSNLNHYNVGFEVLRNLAIERMRLEEIARKLNLPFVDVTAAMMKEVEPKKLFPLAIAGHYTERACQIVTKELEPYLNR